jgi:type I restriction enzyme S subunit
MSNLEVEVEKSAARWRVRPLRDAITPIRGVTFPSGEARPSPFEGSVACLTTSAVQSEVVWESRRFIPAKCVKDPSRFLAFGDLLVSTANSKALVGKSCLVRELPYKCTFGAFVTVFRPKDGFDPGYLSLFMRSKQVMDCCYELSSNTTNISNLSIDDLLSKKFPFPSFSEQRSIANRLFNEIHQLEHARESARKQLAELDLLPQKLLGQVFSERWPTVRLGELLHGIETGRSLQTTEQIARDDELGVIKVSAMTWGEFRPREAKSIEADYQPDEHHRIRKGDVLISRANTVELVGAVVRVDRDYPNRLLSDKSLRLVLDESKCDPDYVVQALRWPEARSHIEENATGTSNSMRNISQDTIRETPLRLPELQEQSRIASTLKSFHVELGRARTASNAQLVELDLLPQRLLAQVFGN